MFIASLVTVLARLVGIYSEMTNEVHSCQRLAMDNRPADWHPRPEVAILHAEGFPSARVGPRCDAAISLPHDAGKIRDCLAEELRRVSEVLVYWDWAMAAEREDAGSSQLLPAMARVRGWASEVKLLLSWTATAARSAADSQRPLPSPRSVPNVLLRRTRSVAAMLATHDVFRKQTEIFESLLRDR